MNDDAERYRSGRNGVDSKSTWGSKALTWVRIPPSPPLFDDASLRRDVRVAEGARLEIVCTLTKAYRGFKSPSLRHSIISIVMIAGSRMATVCEPRQVRKEAAVAITGACYGVPGYRLFGRHPGKA